MPKTIPYVRYERNQHEDPRDVNIDLIRGLRSRGVEVFIMGIVPDEIHGGASIVRYYPNGRNDSTGMRTYEGPTHINFFLTHILPKIPNQRCWA